MRLGQLAADCTIVLRVARLALLLERQGGKLDRIENVAEIQLGYGRDRIVRQPC